MNQDDGLRRRQGLVLRLLALCELAKVRVVGDPGGPFYVDTGEHEPSSWHVFDRLGGVVLHECSYSGHNGDSYDHRSRQLSSVDALQALEGTCSRVEAKALAAEARALEEHARRRLAAAAKKNLDARLKNKGITG